MKNIVICCDGTGNEISENISNVLKLYRMLRKTGKTEPHQLVFYDPGVGTLARPDPWRKVWQDTITILGLATGYGLDDNVLAAYDFLVRNYEDGDDIFLFGFSRGAYTVRVLAGLVHKVGLVSPQQSNLSGGAGLTAYKQFSSDAEQGGLGLGIRASQLVDGGQVKRNKAAPLLATIRRRNSRAFFPPGGRRSNSSACGTRSQASSFLVPTGFTFPACSSLPIRSRTQRKNFPAGDSDRRTAPDVSASAVGTSRKPSCGTGSARPTMKSRRISCRYGSQACTPISAAATRRKKAASRNIRCRGGRRSREIGSCC